MRAPIAIENSLPLGFGFDFEFVISVKRSEEGKDMVFKIEKNDRINVICFTVDVSDVAVIAI